jgi:hypothetical protein
MFERVVLYCRRAMQVVKPGMRNLVATEFIANQRMAMVNSLHFVPFSFTWHGQHSEQSDCK